MAEKKDDFIGMAIAGILGALGLVFGMNLLKGNSGSTSGKPGGCGCELDK